MNGILQFDGYVQQLSLFANHKAPDKKKVERCVDNALTTLRVFEQRSCSPVEKLKIEEMQGVVLKLTQKINSVGLKTLSIQIEDVLKYGIIKDKFLAQSTDSIFTKIISPVRGLLCLMTSGITDQVNKLVYVGWAKKIKNKNLQKTVEAELKARYEKWAERKLDKAKTNKHKKQVVAQLDDEMAHIAQKAEQDDRLKKITKQKQKGEETRMQFMAIGGKRVELETADHVKLDATYLSADEFVSHLNKNNGAKITLPLGHRSINGISFTKSPDFIKLLQDLNLVDSTIKDENGQFIIKEGSGYILMENRWCRQEVMLIPKQELYQFNIIYPTDASGIYKLNERFGSPKYTILSLDAKASGAAILTSGNAGLYEMHKGEALALLMRGMDVMLLNLRGYGESDGTPSVDGSYLDIEAAYQFVKKKRPDIPDSKMVAWSMCMSGGIGAHLVEQHPEMNLFLNQTYAEIGSIIKEQVADKVSEFLGVEAGKSTHDLRAFFSSVITDIVFFALSFVAPNYNVKNRLKHVKGQVCTLQALSDTLMCQKETEAMSAVMQKHKVKHHQINIPGEHCENWTQSYVPEITIQTAGGMITKGIQDYLKVEYDNTTYYLPKEVLNSGRAIDIGLRKFQKGDNGITMTKNHQTVAVKAVELEQSDSRDFIDTLKRASNFTGDIQWVALGHRGVNNFFTQAKLGTSLI